MVQRNPFHVTRVVEVTKNLKLRVHDASMLRASWDREGYFDKAREVMVREGLTKRGSRRLPQIRTLICADLRWVGGVGRMHFADFWLEILAVGVRFNSADGTRSVFARMTLSKFRKII